eukprot:3604618-Pyramimonas_sp.AAC.1
MTSLSVQPRRFRPRERSLLGQAETNGRILATCGPVAELPGQIAKRPPWWGRRGLETPHQVFAAEFRELDRWISLRTATPQRVHACCVEISPNRV